jgi:myo-inositol-1(or 4)-monophosphatase
MSSRGAQDWDIAAAALILEECGIALMDVCSGPPLFNKRDVRHGALAALSDMSLKPLVHAALIKVYGCPSPAAPTPDPSLPS